MRLIDFESFFIIYFNFCLMYLEDRSPRQPITDLRLCQGVQSDRVSSVQSSTCIFCEYKRYGGTVGARFHR